MSLTPIQLNKIASYVRGYLVRSAEYHGHKNAVFRANARWQHTLNVYQNLQQILNGEKAAPDVREACIVAALLHDIDHYTVEREYHAMRGAETAARFLTKEGYPPDFVARVAKIVREHDQDLIDDQPIEAQAQYIAANFSSEVRMMIDADVLDKIGVNNILQSVCSMAINKMQLADISRELAAGWPLQRAGLWRQLLTTPTGQQLGKERYAFYENLVNQIQTEILLTDPFEDVRVTQEFMPV